MLSESTVSLPGCSFSQHFHPSSVDTHPSAFPPEFLNSRPSEALPCLIRGRLQLKDRPPDFRCSATCNRSQANCKVPFGPPPLGRGLAHLMRQPASLFSFRSGALSPQCFLFSYRYITHIQLYLWHFIENLIHQRFLVDPNWFFE